MRSPGAVFLLVMLLFNWFGYRLVIGVLETENNSQLEARLDENHYDESQLISIKVPVRYLPYYSNSTEFQRVDGQIEIGGVQYKYVKRRIYADSLELLCIPNAGAMQLQTAENEFFRFSNDLQHEKRSGDNSHARKFFHLQKCTVQPGTRLITPVRVITAYPSCPPYLLAIHQHSPADQPPEMA
jgi:hypothetical protein